MSYFWNALETAQDWLNRAAEHREKAAALPKTPDYAKTYAFRIAEAESCEREAKRYANLKEGGGLGLGLPPPVVDWEQIRRLREE